MALIVQKFGGTSVADTKKILSAARKAIREVKNGHQVVMVVSAMGKNTDHLIELAKQITDRPNSREMDMLLSTGEQVTISLMAIALQTLGHEAVSFTAAQIGIVTDNSYNKARIRSISTDRMRKALDEGKIIIVAGFQGIDNDLNITTLGRGGSDTTAVALAAALHADRCDIYTDVDGVYTTDPRIVPEARRVEKISYDEMLEMASLGAGVMHSRSIEFAKKYGVKVHVRSSFSDYDGTIIGPDPEYTNVPVCGIALAKNEARLTILDVPDKPGVAMNIFSKIAEAKIPTDMIVQNSSAADGKTSISFTVLGEDFVIAEEIANQVAKEVGASGIECSDNVSKLSIVGLGMAHLSGVAQKMFHALAKQSVNIQLISTSDIKISVLVDRDDAVNALRVIHEEFELHLAPPERSLAGTIVIEASDEIDYAKIRKEISAEAVNRIAGMEDIFIEKVKLDESQARITLADVPDKPGLAAEVFDRIAAGAVIVDMIVQNAGRNNLATIGFTIPRGQFEEAKKIADDIVGDYHCGIRFNPSVAKLSVFGTGLRSHTELASRMFNTLSVNDINVSLISTSEHCVSVILDDIDGVRSNDLLHKEFESEIL